MEWLHELWSGESVAHTVFVLCLVAVAGLALGNLKIKGVGLGIAGVLFSGLIFAHFGIGINHETLEFLREFGLILFVYSIGTQVGPSFLSSLKKQGLALNAMAASIVLLGAIVTIAIAKLTNIPFPVAAGLFSGATTNTPSLAAGTEALKGLPLEAFAALGPGVTAEEASKMPALGYAVAYPFGILGIILTMFLIKAIFKVNVEEESKVIEAQRTSKAPPLKARSVQVQNTELEGVPVRDVSSLAEAHVVVSRHMRDGNIIVAKPEKKLRHGDVVVGVGTDEDLERFERLLGGPAEVDVKAVPSDVQARRFVVTQEKVSGKTLEELGLLDRSGVVVTRVRRMELEFTPKPDFKLQLGDSILVVGEAKNMDDIAKELGDAPAQLDHPRVIPLFLGISLGVLLGSIPIPIPGIPVGVKLGLAGGPLLVSLILSAKKRIGPLNFYMPKSANFALREVGIVLFMACVGLKSGGSFIATLQGPGLMWMGYGALITAIPLAVVALAARAIWKLNYASLCGLLSGSMTDPPALAFAGAMTNSEAPSLSYATVYPLVMLMRVVCAQLLILFFLR